MTYSFPKSARLLTQRQFRRPSEGQRRHVSHHVIIEIVPNSLGVVRLGITVSKRFCKAHDRNRFKRIVREAFRLTRSRLQQGYDLIVKPGSETKNATTREIVTAFLETKRT